MSITDSTQTGKVKTGLIEGAADTAGQQIEKTYPDEFLSFLAGRLEATIQNILALYAVPEKAIKALDNLQYIQIMIHSDPDQWCPRGRQGYEVDLRDMAESTIRQISELDNLSSEYIRKNYDRLSKTDLVNYLSKSGWKE